MRRSLARALYVSCVVGTAVPRRPFRRGRDSAPYLAGCEPSAVRVLVGALAERAEAQLEAAGSACAALGPRLQGELVRDLSGRG